MGQAKRKEKSSKQISYSQYAPTRDYDDVEDVEDDNKGLPTPKKEVKTRSSRSKKEKKKIILDTAYKDALNEVSDVDFENISSNLDLMYALRKVLINTLITSRGAFNAKPTQGNAMTTAKLVRDIEEMTKSIENATDYEQLVKGISDEIVKPFLERLLLELGQSIQDAIEKHAITEKQRKLLKLCLDDMYRSYGSLAETKVPQLEEQLNRYILDRI